MTDLKWKLIKDTTKLITETNNNDHNNTYCGLIDYNRSLFNYIYELDLFDFIPQDEVDKFCKEHNRCRKYLL